MKTTMLLLLVMLPVLTAMNGDISVERVEMDIEQRMKTQLFFNAIPEPMQGLIIAQAKLESGSFTNRLSREGNNIFSMRHPTKRPTLSLGPLLRAEGRCCYAAFESIETAVDDYILYMEHFNVPDTFTTTQEYATYLKRKGYYECSVEDYTRLLNSLL
jgi:Uncharacterized FlgJ-related protein